MGNVCTFLIKKLGNIFTVRKRRIFKWRIEGFSSLLALNETDHYSRSFQFENYSWRLKILPKNINPKSGEGCIGLFLSLDHASSLPSSTVIDAVFKLRICHQLFNYHSEHKVVAQFRNKFNEWGCDNFIALKDFQDLTSGFLVEDNYNFDVEFLKLRTHKIDYNGMFECLSVQKRPASYSYTWKVEKFSELQRPSTSSDKFVVGGHTWNLKLFPDGIKKNNCVAILLNLANISTLAAKSELYVDFSMCLQDQVNGNHKKFSDKLRFGKYTSLGWEFPLDDFQDPSKGFLLKDACIIDASVLICGSCT